MRLKVLMVLMLIAIGFYGGFFLAKALEYESQELSVRAERVIPAMETARDSHQYFVDNPDKAIHATTPDQDAQWVAIYIEVIDILEQLGK